MFVTFLLISTNIINIYCYLLTLVLVTLAHPAHQGGSGISVLSAHGVLLSSAGGAVAGAQGS